MSSSKSVQPAYKQKYRGHDITIHLRMGNLVLDSRPHWEYQYKIDNPICDTTTGVMNSKFYTFEEAIGLCEKYVDDAIELEQSILRDAVKDIERERKHAKNH